MRRFHPRFHACVLVSALFASACGDSDDQTTGGVTQAGGTGATGGAAGSATAGAS